MSPRSIALSFLIAGCGAASTEASVPSSGATSAGATSSGAAEACSIPASGTWGAPHARFERDGAALVWSTESDGLWRMEAGAPERIVAPEVFMPVAGWRPTHIEWAEGWWAVLDDEGHLMRRRFGTGEPLEPLGLPACAWMRSPSDRIGSLAHLTNGDWLLGCHGEVAIASAAGSELARFSLRRFTDGATAIEVEGRRLVLAMHPHQGLAAFDAATGALVWRSELRRTTVTFAARSDAPHVIVTYFENRDGSPVEGGRSGVFGLDPRTGAVVWELPYPPPLPPGSAGTDPRSPSQLVPRWIDATHFSLEGMMLVESLHRVRQIQRMALGAPGEPPRPDGPEIPLDDLYGSAAIYPDVSIGVLGDRYVERDGEGEWISEIAISPEGGARRWMDGRIACPESACPWPRPCA